ncbi:hypothetical protein ABTM55_19210, partial [Acinetobacter baumannii]
LMASGAGALYIADFVDWHAAYWAMAALMMVGMTATLLAPGFDRAPAAAGAPAAPRARLRASLIEPFADLIRRKGPALALILPLVALYR